MMALRSMIVGAMLAMLSSVGEAQWIADAIHTCKSLQTAVTELTENSNTWTVHKILPEDVAQYDFPRLLDWSRTPPASYPPKLMPYIEEYCCAVFIRQLRGFSFFSDCDIDMENDRDEADANKALAELFTRAHNHARHRIQYTTPDKDAPAMLEAFDALYKSCVTDKLLNLAP